jgi:hypothetical protein
MGAAVSRKGRRRSLSGANSRPRSCTTPAACNRPTAPNGSSNSSGCWSSPSPSHEEVFREPREYCAERSRNADKLVVRKFFYLFTCEYCFSHYVTIFFLFVTRFRLLLDDWRGYLIAFFALVAVANVYMSSFGRLRQEVKSEKLEAETKEKVLEKL